MKKILNIIFCGIILIGTVSAQSGIVDTVKNALEIFDVKDTDKTNDCPEGGTRSKSVPSACCKDGLVYTQRDASLGLRSGYDETLPEACGCPDGGIAGRAERCCKDGKEYIFGKGYNMQNSKICCPDGGTVGKDYDTCCQNGHSYVEGFGYIGDGEQCCKEDEEMLNGKCYEKCKEGEHRSRIPNVLDKGYICCQNGTEAKNRLECCDSNGQCCERGKKDETGKCCQRGLDSSGKCCPFGTNSRHNPGKCCKDNEMVGPKGDCCLPGTAGCCDEGEFLTPEGKCEKACNESPVSPGRFLIPDPVGFGHVEVDKVYYICGQQCSPCPSSSPVAGVKFTKVEGIQSSVWDGTCHECPAGQVFSCESPTYCTCPEGGFSAKNSIKICCSSDGKTLDADGKYTKDNPEHCGCPNGATLKEGLSGLAICCKDGWLVDNDGKPVKDGRHDWCGCPPGSTIKGGYCCKDGQVADGGVYRNPRSFYEIKACGCPDGGKLDTSTGNAICCKDGQFYWYGESNLGYRDPDSRDTVNVCGCPKGKKPDNGLCCELNEHNSNGLCCKLNEHNSYGHCCSENTEWSEYTSSGFLGIGGGKTSGKCCPVGTTFNGDECIGSVCPANSVYCDEKTGKCYGT